MARKIVVTSGKGGVGKTTVAANLAAQVSLRGARTVLCDADFGLNNADVVTGVENAVVYDVVDVIEGRSKRSSSTRNLPIYIYFLVPIPHPSGISLRRRSSLFWNLFRPISILFLSTVPQGLTRAFTGQSPRRRRQSWSQPRKFPLCATRIR